ncbi:ABC transporter substrate-binding protein [Aquamicrobium defluvii]|uniref:Iron ABC transporter substrate-binding protein n=1 Tax=Aquamicrobium defluvii TaxID=69279 RepID=A0A011TD77_9HYPH|nr:ABC transporter substrate-binding protein [Aquamicrobium defluvii]EXL09609.1 iron ABC transporter substrate-binding protein [Aquamicrobium defluvii]EZQ16357.1 iron ABC transporter substrate-binding protein [Halopseudomonas bauzanensis]TDR36903.1 putative spermidine/putrescine transport system substrate-binding protein [Aquamicrobium defluvii]
MFKFAGKVLSVTAAALMVTSAISSAQSLDEIVEAAKKEGMLTTIALPHDWCGWEGILAGFKAKYPEITINELNPDAGSADEIEAIRANKGNTGPQAPDVIDVGLAFGPSSTKEGLLLPYKVSTFDGIEVKDPDGHWYGGYYGVLAFEVNTDIVKEVPQDWADLLKPEYANSVALAGDPRAANQAILSVYAAGLSAAGGDASKASEAGLDFFKQLNEKGNFVPVIGKASSLAQGTTPIIVRWDYNALADRDTLNGNPPVEVVVPKSGVLAGVYAQAISAYAPHPNAAKLWLEYIYSDEGQLGFLKGYCHPARFNQLVSEGKVPQEILDKLPPAEAYTKAVFPSLEEQDANKNAVTGGWDSVVGANVQ